MIIAPHFKLLGYGQNSSQGKIYSLKYMGQKTRKRSKLSFQIKKKTGKERINNRKQQELAKLKPEINKIEDK